MLVFWTGCVSPDEGMIKSTSSLSPGQHPQTFERKVSKKLSFRYLLFLPEGYGENRQSWPTILFLHGSGERGDDLKKVKSWGPPKLVERKKDFPFIVISPQCPKGDRWHHHIDVLINLLDDIVSRYNVDTKRIYLTGLSMGGYGTWDLACGHPERFAAIAPFCGGGPTEKACNLKNVPVWAFHGAKDKTVPLEKTVKMVNAVKACGGNTKLTVYPDVGHGCWKKAYNGKELYDWFLKHLKKSLSEINNNDAVSNE